MPKYQRDKFSNDELRNFVSLVRRHDCIYNLHHEDHKDYVKTKQAWETIAEICNREGYTGEDWKRKWKSMRDIYIKYKKRVQMRIKYGLHVKKWIYADIMAFLDDYMEDDFDSIHKLEINPQTYSDEDEIEPQIDVNMKLEPSSPFSFDLPPNQRVVRPALFPDIASTSRSSPEPSSHHFEEEPPAAKRCRDEDSSVLDRTVARLLKKSALSEHQLSASSAKSADDLLFESYACRMKQLPENTKGLVRMQLSQIFFNAEHPDMPALPILTLPRPSNTDSVNHAPAPLGPTEPSPVVSSVFGNDSIKLPLSEG